MIQPLHPPSDDSNPVRRLSIVRLTLHGMRGAVTLERVHRGVIRLIDHQGDREQKHTVDHHHGQVNAARLACHWLDGGTPAGSELALLLAYVQVVAGL
ncbi:hypothetical protein ACERK3_13795 [Phycisphaerales bacterium AB-hyl4]|uniref:Uncharacterized protein n=1 Tax=Natronomicrosphaera hydrolytica TaxID=3242702 RepID=A0ABV4U8Q6_9BACT